MIGLDGEGWLWTASRVAPYPWPQEQNL